LAAQVGIITLKTPFFFVNGTIHIQTSIIMALLLLFLVCSTLA